ncbi:MAG: HAD family hydrolase [Thaumarchaeota archaeon]|nr:HAD family hydrolase [Nitrososphaerota archaeon]
MNALKAAPKTLLFDMDGTLIKFKFKVKESRRALIAKLREMGFDASSFSEEMPTQLIYDSALQQIRQRKLNLEFKAVKGTLGVILDRFESEAFSESELNPSVVDVLSYFKSQGFKMGLVTNDGRAAASVILDKHSLRRFFDIVITRDDVERMKPDPEGILRASAALGVDPSEALYVGDSVLDVQAAKSAGIGTVVSIIGGVHANDRILKAAPDLIVSKPSDLLEVFGKTNP